jgi:hypothetical protein
LLRAFVKRWEAMVIRAAGGKHTDLLNWADHHCRKKSHSDQRPFRIMLRNDYCIPISKNTVAAVFQIALRRHIFQS